MEPSKELDALVAEHVLGWDRIHYKFGGNVAYGRPNDDYRRDFPNNRAYENRILAYSTDVAAAFTVDKPGWLWDFQETSQTLTVTLYTSSEMKQRAISGFPIFPKDAILVRREWLKDKAQTYAWLRCLAALEATGVEAKDA